jgi:hypothetical protein
MQLRLSSILALSALAVCLLSQADWKPYSLAGLGAVASSDEERSGTILAEIVRGKLWSRIFSANSANKPTRSEVLVRRTDSNASESKVRMTPDPQIAEVIGQQSEKMTNGSTLAIAGRNAHAAALVDDIVETVRLNLPDHSPVALIAKNRGKVRLMLSEKSLMNLNFSDIVIRELQKEIRRAEREERAEEDDTKCPAEAEGHSTQGSEQVERFGSRPY